MLVYSLKVSPLIEKISDHKDFKKLLRTRNNVLVLYSKSGKSSFFFFFLMPQLLVPSKVCAFDQLSACSVACVRARVTGLCALPCSLLSVALCDCKVLLCDCKGFFRISVLALTRRLLMFQDWGLLSLVF